MATQNGKQEVPLMVTINCLVFNHEPYLRKCLEGFVMQKTNFRFEAIVHDDASTDGSVAIICEYARKYPDIIKPIIETENQYSKRDGSLARIMDKNTYGKYIALCEGDDYWTDPNKLQMQVEFLENHLDYSMCCAGAEVQSGGRITEILQPEEDCDLTPEDTITRGGAFIPTLSILFRKELLEGWREFRGNSLVGDYPLQIYCSIRGKVRFFKKIVGCYRLLSIGSWSYNHYENIENRIQYYKLENDWLEYANEYTQREYHDSFSFVIGKNLYLIAVMTHNYTSLRFNRDVHHYITKSLSFKTKISFYMKTYYLKWLYNCWFKAVK